MTSEREDLLLRRQKILADFGDFALQSEDLDEVLTQACRLVAGAMETGRAKVLEIEKDGETLLVRAGVGWAPDIVGRTRISMRDPCSESFAINERKPVISPDVSREERFALPGFMTEEGVRALASVPILLPGGRAFGLLEIDASEPRAFDQDDVAFLRTYATILGPIVDRILKLSALRTSEERFRHTVEEASDYAILVTDQNNCITDWLPGAAKVFGWSADEAIGQSGSILFTPEDRDAGADAREAAQARETGFAPSVRWHLRKDGTRVFIEGSVRALKDAKDHVTGFIKVGQDVTQRREADIRLHESELRFRTLAEGIPQLVWRAADPGIWTWASPQWTAFTGQPDVESRGWGWLEPVHPDDRDSARAAWERARTTGAFEADYRVREAATGKHCWFQTRATPVRDEAGHVVEWLGTSTDVQNLREMQERQRVLVAELQHRTRNLMTVTLALSHMTARASTDLDHFRTRFQARIEALARVQGLLSRLNGDYDRVTFDELIQTELSAMAGRPDRVTLSGPSGIRLRSSTVQTLAMALHELATNAVKYGALGQVAGRLAITWSLDPEGPGGVPWLHLDWRESGVEMPPAGTAPRGTGQGRELIEQALPYQLKAKTTYAFMSDGVHCTIAMPVSASIGEQEAHA